MKYSLIIPNYNGAENLKKNIPKNIETLKRDEAKYEIIVVDDFSSDDSVKSVKDIIKENSTSNIKLLKNKRNLGFATTVSNGVSASSGDIVILLNSDAYLRTNPFKFLPEDFKNEKVFAAGFLDESEESGRLVLRGRGVGKWSRGFLHHRPGFLDKADSLWASGGSSAYRKSYWENFGGMDQAYNPFYWEDIDLSYRALKRGYEIKFDNRIIVRHEHEKGIIRKQFSPEQIKRIAYRNQFLFVWKNADGINILQNLIWLPFHLLNAISRKDRPFIQGYLDFLTKLPGIIKSRKNYKKIRSDAQITQEII